MVVFEKACRLIGEDGRKFLTPLPRRLGKKSLLGSSAAALPFAAPRARCFYELEIGVNRGPETRKSRRHKKNKRVAGRAAWVGDRVRLMERKKVYAGFNLDVVF